MEWPSRVTTSFPMKPIADTPQTRLAELLPWNWAIEQDRRKLSS